MASLKFQSVIERVLKNEGGYVFHPSDPGGETKFGISKRAFPDVIIGSLTKQDAIDIYEKHYWNRINGDKLPEEIAYQVLDAAVLHGIGNAIRFLQRAVGVVDDGLWGGVSERALAMCDAADVVLRFNAERLEFIAKLSTFSTFGKGWVNRIASNLRYAALDN
jgi:lysozyme family protein